MKLSRISDYLPGMRLRGKFILAIIGIILLAGLVATAFVHITLTQILTNELQERGIVITKNLAANSVDPLLTENLVSLQRLLFDVEEVEEDVSYVYITDSGGYVIVHTFEGGFPNALIGANIIPSDQAFNIQLLDTEEGFIRDIAVPILEGRAGTVHVGMSENRIRGEIFKTTETLIGITFLVMILGIFLAYIAGNLITRPIHALTKGVEEMGRGNLDYKIKVESKDEINVLADAFNQMALNLKDSMDKIKGYSIQLEQKVEERTKELLLLQRINNLLNIGASQEEIFKTITEGLTSVYNYDLSAIYLLNGEGTHLICKGYSTNSKIVKKAEELTRVTALNYAAPLHEGGLLSKVVETKEPIVTSDIVGLIKDHTDRKELKLLANPIARIVGIKFGIGVPLLAGDKVVGTIGVGSKERLSNKDSERLKNFAEQVGLAVEKVRMEQQLKEYSERLEQKVEEKTRQLIQSEKLASVGQLAAGVAHEINNPLTNILLDAEALRYKKLDDNSSRQRLEEIISEVQTATGIVKNLLDFSRQAKPVIESVDIKELVDRTLDMIPHRLRNVRIEKNYPPHPIQLAGDPNQLQQVFLNIFINAIQAMPNGGRLGISMRRDNEFIKIDVSDTGHGIAEEDLGKIFDPFYSTRGGEGTGLGLSICLGIVERHGGEIKVESKVGVGSTFAIRLPIGEAND